MLNFHSFVVIANDKDFFAWCIASSAVKLGSYDEKEIY